MASRCFAESDVKTFWLNLFFFLGHETKTEIELFYHLFKIILSSSRSSPINDVFGRKNRSNAHIAENIGFYDTQ